MNNNPIVLISHAKSHGQNQIFERWELLEFEIRKEYIKAQKAGAEAFHTI